MLLIGAGGHGRVLLDALLSSGRIVLGILEDDLGLQGQDVHGVRVLGGDDWADRLAPTTASIAMGVVGFGPQSHRRDLVQYWSGRGFELTSIVHPAAVVSRVADLGSGSQVLAGAVINAGARIGPHVIVNSAAVVEHDCVLEEGAHLAPGAVLGGAATVGAWAQLGLNATVLPGRRVGAGAIVGAGAVVTQDVPPNTVVIGVPARVQRHLN